MIVNAAPFRATAQYLGNFSGQYLFAMADHIIAAGDVPSAVEFGQSQGNTFSVTVEGTPIFQSGSGDIAILRASASALTPET